MVDDVVATGPDSAKVLDACPGASDDDGADDASASGSTDGAGWAEVDEVNELSPNVSDAIVLDVPSSGGAT